MTTDNDTEISELAASTPEIPPPPPAVKTRKEERAGKSDRELLELVHDRLDGFEDRIEKLERNAAALQQKVTGINLRLGDGDQLFALGDKREKQHDADWTTAMRFMQSLNTRLAHLDPIAKLEADAIERAIDERFANGEDHHEHPTSPENLRPSGPPDAE